MFMVRGYGDLAKKMTEEVKRFKYEAMGYHAFAKGIKNAADDPDFVDVHTADVKEYEMSPEDDWNQGWLIAAAKNRENNL